MFIWLTRRTVVLWACAVVAAGSQTRELKERDENRIYCERGEHRKKECFILSGGGPFWGTISHFAKECGGNVHVKGVEYQRIEQRVQSMPPSHKLWMEWLLDYNGSNSWICFDFKE